MAKLIYADIIRQDVKFTTLADLTNRLDTLDKSQIMTSLIFQRTRTTLNEQGRGRRDF